MAEAGSLKGDRLAMVERLAKRMYDGLVAAVIADVRALPDNCRQSGDDSGLADVWEEFKDQMQNEESTFFDLYEHTIQSLCAKRIEELDTDRRCFLWLFSEGYLNRWVDEDAVSLTDLDLEHISDEVYRRVCDVAANEKLACEEDNPIDLAELVMTCWPADWPGRQFVEWDNVGDAGAWLEQHVVEPALDRLTEGEISDDDPLAEGLAVDYLESLANNSFDMPWTSGDDPNDPDWIAECRAGIQKEFVAFLRHWRERIKESMAKMRPPPAGGV